VELISNDTFLKRNSYLLLAAAWLLTIAFIINNYWSVTSTPQSVQKRIQIELTAKEKTVDKLFSDTTFLETIINNNYDEKKLQDLVDRKFYVFAFEQTPEGLNEIFWNTQDAHPDSAGILSNQAESFGLLDNGWFITKRKIYKSKEGTSYKFISLIPVKWNYYIQNKYLQNNFFDLPKLGESFSISTSPTKLEIVSQSGQPLFWLHQEKDIPAHDVNMYALSLGILALLLVLFFIHILANYISRNYGIKNAITILIGLLALIRILTYELDPYDFRQMKLFSPSVYGTNFLMRSLGDLFVNSILLIWIILFIRYHLRFNFSKLRYRSEKTKYLLALGISMIMVLITFAAGSIILSLVADPQISFDVINFFSLNIYSAISFIVLTCVATAYFFLIQLLIQPFNVCTSKLKYLRYLFLAASGLIVLSFNSGNQVSFYICLLLWLLLFIYLLDFKILLLHAYRLISSRFIFWAFFFSLSIAAVIIVQNRSKELDARKKFAENLANKADPAGPVIMNIILTDFRNEYLSKIFYKFRDPLDNLMLKDSLVRETFSGYLNKYNTEIYTYDSSGNALFNLRPVSFNDLNAIIQSQGKPTGIPDLFYYDVSYANFNYISRKQITDTSGQTEGYVFIVSKPKKLSNDALYPELFSRGNSNSIESSSEYAFAIYNNGRLSNSYNDYPFSTHIGKLNLEHHQFKTIHKNGYEELWYQPRPDKVIVITRQDRFVLESITLFAYLFCSFLVITIFFNLLGHLISDRKTRGASRPFWQLTIRNQVHGTIILISLFSFIVIGISTILFFINRYHNNNRELLSRTIHVMENELHTTIDSSIIQQIKSKTFEEESQDKLTQVVNNVSNIHATDINLYDLNGNLRVSSVPLPYEKGIVSEKMDPVAWYHLNHLQEAQFFQEQNIGTLRYLSNYLPVRDENGNEYAYLNIPYFESQNRLQDEISNFLVAIINLNAFIFLIAGVIALFITNKITRSFLLISDKMKQINLQTGNEEIVWNRKDEIGDLVNEYNKMVRQLEVSAQKLARSEREGAWREMARQVAHEIKNPLTPMKLNLQYLQMAIDKNSPDVKNISLYVAKIMLEQIEHLSQIASDFAQFANISNTKMQYFDLNETLKNVVTLYSTNEKVTINATYEPGGLMIHADKTQVNRLFTNLLQNALQSVPDFRIIEISIKSKNENGNALVSIKDNGTGIPAAMQEKIFTPNFTTKSSGTGLGLAMCKGIVEKIGGNIWFETEVGEWTNFYVSIPLSAKPEEV